MASGATNLESLGTPPNCVADFCLIPVSTRARLLNDPPHLVPPQLGTPTASVSQQIADVQRLLQQSKLSYSMHSAGTTLGKSIARI